MHFAVGMCGGAVISLIPCLIRRRGYRHIPLVMTACGVWANIPDCPRLWRVDFTGLPFAGTLGSMELERWLHKYGDIFFFHHALDAQPKEFALLGLFATIGLYNVCLLGMWWHMRKRRISLLDNLPDMPLEHRRPAYPSENQPHPASAGPVSAGDDLQPGPVLGRIGTSRTG